MSGQLFYQDKRLGGLPRDMDQHGNFLPTVTEIIIGELFGQELLKYIFNGKGSQIQNVFRLVKAARPFYIKQNNTCGGISEIKGKLLRHLLRDLVKSDFPGEYFLHIIIFQQLSLTFYFIPAL